MKSQKRRVKKLESETLNHSEDVPKNIPEIYALEDNPETETAMGLEQLYNPNRNIRNPNKAI